MVNGQEDLVNRPLFFPACFRRLSENMTKTFKLLYPQLASQLTSYSGYRKISASPATRSL